MSGNDWFWLVVIFVMIVVYFCLSASRIEKDFKNLKEKPEGSSKEKGEEKGSSSNASESN